MNYIDNVMLTKINNIVDEVYPNLNFDHKNILKKQLSEIIDFTCTKFNFDEKNKSIYIHKLTENDNEDIKSFLNMLLPYIDTTRKNTSNIRSLNDLYIQKQDNNKKMYEFSNLQYGRCKRLGKNNFEEIQFRKEHLIHNFNLLKDTIQIVSNKLHVNWLDIRPHSFDSVKEKDIYKITKKVFSENNLLYYDPSTDNETMKNYRGIYIGDIYNTIRNYLYEDIVPIKWLIFDLTINGKLEQIINIIDRLFGMKIHKTWNKITDSERRRFDNSWKNLLDVIKSNTSVNGFEPYIIKYVLKAVTVFFDKRYGKSDAIIERGYIPISVDIGLDDELIRDITNDDKIFKSTFTIAPDIIYNFIIDNLEKYDSTWYGKQNKTIIYEDKDEIKLTLKNIYNYAKSISNRDITEDNITKYSSFSKYWRGLIKSDKGEILRRLNSPKDTNIIDWFNIGRYIKYTYGKDADVEKINTSIHNMIKDYIIDIIFEVLVTKGILSEFIPLKQVTDKNYIPKDTKLQGTYTRDTLRSIVFNPNMNRWKNSYYYITDTKYTDVIIKDKNGTKTYLDATMDGDAMYWMNFYAFSWVSQIALYHRYLNCRVIYVTGATGVGKSAAVPRLMLYSLKMIDYKINGKVINSQPRRSPTEGNPTGMAIAMGVPLTEYDNKLGRYLPSNNFYLQFKHQMKEHTGRSKGLTLKVVTDGTMYQMIKGNPLCKSAWKNPQTGEINYKIDNMYDILMVDEAHEHNKNMDMVLTLSRYSCHYNNDIKLVIVSATMEDDEPVYRRYYRNINDNKMFPINPYLIEHNLDRINIDRRVHISRPGATTRYKINDYYQPNVNPDEIVVQIANSSSYGDILLFRPGLKEIGKSFDYLINNLPSNFVVLPFHAKLSNENRNFVEKLTPDSVKEYTLPRHVRFDKDIDKNTDNDIKMVPKGTYNRAVIIATTIAEASITINSLVYVVDTGTQKVEIYDYDTMTSKLIEKSISDSSRKQRRGRVGRKAPGDVYYTYPEGLTETIKTQFDISISNISSLIFDLLKNSANENIFITDNMISSLSLNLKYGLGQIFKYQYYYNNLFVQYIGNPGHYDYENYVEPPAYYQTGYSIDILIDSLGSFYIVHPEELQINRNILGNITNLVSNNGISYNSNDMTINSKKMLSFISSLQRDELIKQFGKEFVKSEYGIAINSLMSLLTDYSKEMIISYIYSRYYGIDNDILKILTMYKIIDGRIKNLAYDDGNLNRYNELKSIYKNQYGDSISLLSIANDILKYVNKFNLEANNKKISYENLANAKRNYLMQKYGNIDESLIAKLRTADHTDKLVYSNKVTEKEILDIFGSRNLFFTGENQVDQGIEDKIYYWSKGNYLNDMYVMRFINEYNNIVDSFSKYVVENDIILAFLDKNIKSSYSNNDKNKLIIASLLHGKGSNIAKRVGGSVYYMMILNPSPNKIYKLRPMDTFIEKVYINEYVMYDKYDSMRDTINIIDNITPHMIQRCVKYAFTENMMNREVYQRNYQIKLIKNGIPGVDITNSKLLSYYLDEIDKLRRDMKKHYNSKVYNDDNNDNNDNITNNNQIGGSIMLPLLDMILNDSKNYYTNKFSMRVLHNYSNDKHKYIN